MNTTTTIPKVSKDKPNTGLFFRRDRGTWHYTYTENGVRKFVDTKAAKEDVSGARRARNRAYKELLTQGAAVAERKPISLEKQARKIAGNPEAYIHRVKPFRFVLGGQILAEGDTFEEVRKARDKHFGMK